MPTQSGNDGTILSLAQAKKALEIEHSNFDDKIGDLIQNAESLLEEYTGTPITAETFTEKYDGGKPIIFLDQSPIDESSVTVTDTQGTVDDATDDETVEAKHYRVYPEEGEIVRTSQLGIEKEWAPGRRRFEVEYDAGLDQHPNWARTVEHTLRQSLKHLLVMWYENRNPDLKSEQMGAGFGQRYDLEDIPPRVLSTWINYKNSLV